MYFGCSLLEAQINGHDSTDPSLYCFHGRLCASLVGPHYTHTRHYHRCSRDHSASDVGQGSQARSASRNAGGHNRYFALVQHESQSHSSVAILLESVAHQCSELDKYGRIGLVTVYSSRWQCRVGLALLDCSCDSEYVSEARHSFSRPKCVHLQLDQSFDLRHHA